MNKKIDILQRLNKLEQQVEQLTYVTPWLDIGEAARYTRLSESTLRRAINAGKLRVSDSTGKLLFQKRWLDAFLVFGRSKLSQTQKRKLDEVV